MSARWPWLGIAPMVMMSATILALVSGCADRRITLRYEQDAAPSPLAGAAAVTVFRFADRRGDEGNGNPLRVGGVYGGYGNRLSQVMADTPWQGTLAAALVAGFKGRGVEAIAVEDREFALGSAFATPLALGGEIRNFSTEARYATMAHISGVVRLYDSKGAMLVEKAIVERDTWGLGAGILTTDEPLEKTLNKALAGFVLKVVMDPDLAAQLTLKKKE